MSLSSFSKAFTRSLSSCAWCCDRSVAINCFRFARGRRLDPHPIRAPSDHEQPHGRGFLHSQRSPGCCWASQSTPHASGVVVLAARAQGHQANVLWGRLWLLCCDCCQDRPFDRETSAFCHQFCEIQSIHHTHVVLLVCLLTHFSYSTNLDFIASRAGNVTCLWTFSLLNRLMTVFDFFHSVCVHCTLWMAGVLLQWRGLESELFWTRPAVQSCTDTVMTCVANCTCSAQKFWFCRLIVGRSV